MDVAGAESVCRAYREGLLSPISERVRLTSRTFDFQISCALTNLGPLQDRRRFSASGVARSQGLLLARKGQLAEAAQHFGPTLVSCEGGDLRLTPQGVEVFDKTGRRFIAADISAVPRGEVIDELWDVARDGKEPLHNGHWSRATLEVCLAILESSRRSVDIMPKLQVGYIPPPPDHA